MLDQLRFDDHTGFQRTALYWTLAGAGGALLALFARGILDITGYNYELLLTMTGMSIGAAAGLLRESYNRIVIGAGLGAGLGLIAALIAGLSLPVAAPLLGAAVAGAGLGLVWGPKRAPAPARGVGFAITAVLGLYVATTLMVGPRALEWLQYTGVQDAAFGGVLGFFLSLGGVVGRMRIDQDPVHRLWAETQSELSGDMAELAEQGVRLYEEILERAEKRRGENKDLKILPEAERVAGATTQRLIRLAERWCQIEKSVDNTTRPRLEARLNALEEKLKNVKDAVIRAEYSAAARTVRDQLKSFEKIDVGRERLVARIHRCLASLERVSLLMLQLSTSDAEDASLSLQPELTRLDEMSDELSWKSLSVDDLLALEEQEAHDEITTALAEVKEEEDAPVLPKVEASTTPDLDAVKEEERETPQETPAVAEVPAEEPAEAQVG